MGSRATTCFQCFTVPLMRGPGQIRLSPCQNALLPGQDLFGLSKQRNTEVVQLLRTL